MGRCMDVMLLVTACILIWGCGGSEATTMHTLDVTDGSCLCTHTNVEVRTQVTLNGSVVMAAGSCRKASGHHMVVDGHSWYEIDTVDIQGTGPLSWIPGDFLCVSETDSCTTTSDKPITTTTAPCPAIVGRDEWGARPTRSASYLSGPVQYTFIHHSAMDECYTRDDCIVEVRKYQDLHMDDRGWDDIGYSFVIGGEGSVFEGRGWDRVGAHTKGYNSVGLGFCLSGNFMNATPTDAQLTAVKKIIECGVAIGKIVPQYTVRGHRDMKSTLCPGDNLYNIINQWDHY